MEIIREAGVYIYGVIVFGMLASRWAISYARSRDAEQRFRWFALMGLTLAVGVLGSVAGLQAAAKYVMTMTVPDRWLVVVGLREALHNVGMSLCFLILNLLLLLFVPRATHAQPEAAKVTLAHT